MPRVRIEWVPVQAYGLGRFGFDHLPLVYQPDDAEVPTGQDAWFVMEGVREAAPDGAYLGIEGANGRTTLSVANLAAREALVAKIGTPEHRGSRCLPYGGNEFQAWETMASYARDIEQQDFPYIAYGLPNSATPTVNSSSAIASLVHYSGLDPSRLLPYGLHLSPGTATLLGTTGDDRMRTEHGFDTLLGGRGRDELRGGSARTDKLYGGEDADLFHWSDGFNIIHGGEPYLSYAADGVDVMDYSGAGSVAITFNRYAIPHKVPSYVAVFAHGTDHLFSIERIQWNAQTDRIVLGDGLELVEDRLVREPAEAMERKHLKTGVLVVRETLPSLVAGDDADNTLVGSDGDDTMLGAGGDDLLIGGAGSDGYVYLPGDGSDTILDTGGSEDRDVLVLAGGIRPQDVTLARPSRATDDLLLELADGARILIKGYFHAHYSGIERVVFDRAPAWSHTEMRRLADAAPVGDEPPSPPRPFWRRCPHASISTTACRSDAAHPAHCKRVASPILVVGAQRPRGSLAAGEGRTCRGNIGARRAWPLPAASRRLRRCRPWGSRRDRRGARCTPMARMLSCM